MNIVEGQQESEKGAVFPGYSHNNKMRPAAPGAGIFLPASKLITVVKVIAGDHCLEGDGMPSLESCYVLTADIIGSRKMGGANKIAAGGLERLNDSCRHMLVAEFALYRGDEIQGVLHPWADLAPLIRRLRFFLRPLKLRIGVGYGGLETGGEGKYSWQMDGRAFHCSREALERIKASRVPATCFAGLKKEHEEAVNTFYLLLDAVESRWSEKQWLAVEAYERCGTYGSAAAELKITPQNVHKRCQAAQWKAVAQVERYLNKLLKEGAGE